MDLGFKKKWKKGTVYYLHVTKVADNERRGSQPKDLFTPQIAKQEWPQRF